MKLQESFWISGLMPVQFLLVLVVVFFGFVLTQFLLERMGKRIPVFAQAILIFFTTFFILKYVIQPPLPSSLLYTYMGLIAIVIFLFISSTEKWWMEFKRPILSTLQGETRKNVITRKVVFILLPLLALIGTYQFVKPVFEEPVELRVNHPAPPAQITIHGKKYNLQTARNPFRTDGPPIYPESEEIN